MFAWLYLPAAPATAHFTLEPLAQDGGESFPRWILKVDSPRSIHLGDSGTLQLTVSPEPTALPPNPITDGSSNYNLIVEARAEIPAAGASPSGLSSQTLAPGRAAQFEWEVTPQSEGMLEGRVWLYLRSLPGDGTESHPAPAERPADNDP
jgi:hypothetical protein